jgi:hypothetical protein
MSRMLFVSAVLVLLMQAPAVLSRPPDGPSGRLVKDAVPALQTEVKRLEKEVARDKNLAEELDVARARLAAAEGRTGEARAAWEKIIATRLARLDVLLSGGLDCDPSDIALYRGAFAEARCGLAEVERDQATLSRELPKVIAFREDSLTRLRRLAKAGAISPDEAEKEEKALHKELREARQRLDAVKRK